MIANITQPSASGPAQTFGGSELKLLSTVQQSSALILQMPAIARSTAIAARSLGFQENEPAFLGLPREWIRIVRDQGSTRRTPVSVFDMPPLNLGSVLRPLTGRADFLDEMMDDTRL
jgi:hypothetical protein